MEDKSLRETLEESIETVETEEEEVVDEVEATAETQTEEETQEEVPTEEPEAVEVAPEKPASNPPVDWSAEVKEKWSDLPPEVQAQISAREAHINETLRDTADIRHEYDSFSTMIQPFIPLMQAEGASDPKEAIQGLLQTTATLTMGSAQQKAQKIAAMINHYGVDIQTLDSLLAGNQPEPETPSDPRIDAIWNQMQTAQQQNAQKAQMDAQNDLQQFAADPEHVHFEAVRERMADWIDMAAARNQTMSLQDAYFKACLEDPNIAPLVTAQYANTGTDVAQRARNAAGSLASKPAQPSHDATSENMSLRDTIKSQLVGDSGRI